MKKITDILIYPLFILPFATALLRAYPGSSRYAALLLPLASFLLGSSVKRLTDHKLERILAGQFCRFLEFISGRVAAGHNLRHALEAAPVWMTRQCGRKSRLSQALDALSRALRSGLSLEQSLLSFQRVFRAERSRSFVLVLPGLERSAGKVDLYLKQLRQTVDSDLNMEKEIESEQSAVVMEAIIMSALPPIVSIMTNGGFATLSNHSLSWLPTAEAALYAASFTAAALCLRALAGATDGRKKMPAAPRLAGKKKNYSPRIKKVAATVKNSYPAGLGHYIQQSLERQLNPCDEIWLRFLGQKFRLTLASVALFLTLFLFSPLPLFLLPLAFFIPGFLQDVSVLSREQELRELCRIEYPPFLNLLVNLLASGLSLQKALELLTSAELNEEPRSRGGRKKHLTVARKNLRADAAPHLLSRDFERLRRRLSAGISASEALAELAQALPLPEISAILQLLCRYEREGGRELLDILKIQAEQSRLLYRQAERRRLNRKSILLLIPMGMDLLIVMLIALLPAAASFSHF